MTRAGVLRLTLDDLPILLQIQQQTLPDTLSARLGSRFNILFHSSMLADEQYLCFGYFVNDAPVGYLSCTTDTQQLLRSAVRDHVTRYVATLGYELLSNRRIWGLATRIAHSIATGRGEPASDVRAEFLSIGVLPSFRGRVAGPGTNVSVASALLRHALTALSERGTRAVKACVTPDDGVANGFYKKHGFVFQERIQRFGLAANLYVRELLPEIRAS